ncbi:protein ENHANCED DISEASE RESISTANCE 2-like [Corylus avellana]|uniref:protein ENHANCED DISEASE RESISTANCE 2-like n=1 Tax=Corylus avellana TaxID=13451 RepID=UPI00286C809D|nr:protein ENHANCED DISEASE RESISTANCE 2-like [Corylus avellana]
METTPLRKSGSEGSESSGGSGAGAVGGWVYHLGVNSIGHEYCHLRFLFIRGKYVEMYKRDPSENPGIKPIRKGVAGPTLLVQELGRRKVNQGDLYVLKFYNRLDEAKKGEIAVANAGEARKWMEAFDHAKQQAEYELSKGGSIWKDIDLE